PIEPQNVLNIRVRIIEPNHLIGLAADLRNVSWHLRNRRRNGDRWRLLRLVRGRLRLRADVKRDRGENYRATEKSRYRNNLWAKDTNKSLHPRGRTRQC